MVQKERYFTDNCSDIIKVDKQQHSLSGAALGATGRDKSCCTNGLPNDSSGTSSSKLSTPSPTKYKGVWVPPSVRHDVAATLNHQDQVFRRVRGILNKITPERFEKLSEELLNAGLDSKAILKGVVLLLVDKALDEPKYSFVYAQLCKHLDDAAPNFDPPGGPTTFRRLLLSKCKDEFENRTRAAAAFDNKVLTPEEEEQQIIAKKKMLGNIRFIGELGKLELLHEKILHLCIKQLLEKKENTPTADIPEDLECLCQIMKTVGRRLDTAKAKDLMHQYFERINLYMTDPELPARIRFMLQDVIELRSSKWVPRHNNREFGPKLIQEIHNDAAKEDGLFIPPSTNLFDGLTVGVSRTGKTDMFGTIPVGALPLANIGTGPGVIMDGFEGSSSGSTHSMFNGRRTQNSAKMGDRPFFDRALPQKNQTYIHTSMPSMTQQHRDMPPRFRRTQKPGATNGDGANGADGNISLRPPTTSMVQLKPNAPRMLPKSAMMSASSKVVSNHDGGTPAVPQPRSISLIPSPDKDKKKEKKAQQQVQSKKALNAEETCKLYDDVVAENLTSEELVTKIVDAFKAEKISRKSYIDFVSHAVKDYVNRPDNERDVISKVFDAFYQNGLVQVCDILEGSKKHLEENADSGDNGMIERVAEFLASAIAAGFATVVHLTELTHDGAFYPLALICLRQTATLKTESWVEEQVRESKVKLNKLLPNGNEELGKVLQMNQLAFLMPMLQVEAELSVKIKEEPNASILYKWIRDNVEVKRQKSAEFVAILISCILKHVTAEAGTIGLSAAPEKPLIDREKDMFARFRPILTAFLHANPALQLEAIYAVQVFCFQHKFPKGMLLRMFVMLYDMEIIEEESFLTWKEDVNDAYPGKGQALFQVNQWLMWLEEAESEDEEEDDEDD